MQILINYEVILYNLEYTDSVFQKEAGEETLYGE